MKVKAVLSILILVMAIAGVSNAAKTILIVSDSAVPGDDTQTDHRDDSLVAFVESLGYIVDTTGMNDAMVEGNNPFNAGSATLAALEAADAVLISRRTNSGAYDGDTTNWNTLAKPLVLMSGYLTRGTRWNWSTAGSGNAGTATTDMPIEAGQEGHAFLDGLDTSGPIGLFDWSSSGGGVAPKGVYLPNTGTLIGDATLIGTFGGRPMLFEIAEGSTMNNADVAGERRAFFATWGYDAGNQGPGGVGDGEFDMYLTDDFKTVLGNILGELAPADPDFNPPPEVDAGPDQSTYIGDTVQLAGTATDEGPENPLAPGSPGGVDSLYWYKLSGPGLATFTPAGGVDDLAPTVTFGDKGVYELVLQVSDIEPKDANDVVVITVKDHADEWMVGHWPLDGDALDNSINSNHGTLKGLAGAEPNGMPQYVTDAAVGTHSIDLIDVLELEAINSHDPNLKHIDLGAATELDFGTGSWTVSGWVKTTQQKGSGDDGKGTIFGNGGDQTGGHRYCLLVSEANNGRTMLVTDDNSTKYTLEDDGPDNDGFWHFIVGQRDGNQLRVYRDGVLDASASISASYDLSGTSQHNSYIGVITDNRDSTIYKHLDGLADDVRVYNYALPLEDASFISILDLAAMGPIVASVDAGADFGVNWKPTSPPAGPLAGVVTDNGRPDVGGFILWTTASGPLIDLGPAFHEASFTDAADPGTTVSFPEAGVYTLKLEVFDPDAVDPDVPGSGYVSDTVVVTVVAPTCADVIADGLLLDNDFDGNCYVGLEDFVVILAGYLQCNDPLDVECQWPF